MNLLQDKGLMFIIEVLMALLLAVTLLGFVLDRMLRGPAPRAMLGVLKTRLLTWWGMSLFTLLVLVTGDLGAVLLCGLLSFGALWDFIGRTPANRGDRPALIGCFLLVLPLQYRFVALDWYALFVIFIPVFTFLVLATAGALAGDGERFLERTGRIHWGLMVEVYFLSHLTALLLWEVPGYEIENGHLLIFLLLVVELGDFSQDLLGRAWGRKKVAARLAPALTWEGFVLAVGISSAVGWALSRLTPFRPSEAALVASLCAVLAFFGRLCLSVVLRDRSPGCAPLDGGKSRPGLSERLAPLCFAAPLFFHCVRFYFAY